MPLPKTLYLDDVCHIASWQNAVIVDVAGDLDLPHMQRLGRAYAEHLKRFPSGIVACSSIRADVPISSAAARAESARFMKELGAAFLRCGMVLEHQGVVAQMIKSVIRAINVVARNPKLVIFSSLDAAALGLAPLVTPTVPGANTGRELLAAIHEVRRELEGQLCRERPRSS